MNKQQLTNSTNIRKIAKLVFMVTLLLVSSFILSGCQSRQDELMLMEDTESSGLTSSDSSETPGFVFKIGNDNEVFNGGTPPTFKLDKSQQVTELWTYYWNNGKGAPDGGTLAIESTDGKRYGPWQVEVKNNVYWVATINDTLPAGSYTVIDSNPETLAQNKESNGQGHAWMYGK